MPTCLIDLHDNEVLRERSAHLLQEESHHGSRSLWQNQRNHLAKGWCHSGIGVDILAYQLSWDMRTHTWRGPTSLWLADATKTAFILSHDQDRPFIACFSRGNCC